MIVRKSYKTIITMSAIVAFMGCEKKDSKEKVVQVPPAQQQEEQVPPVDNPPQQNLKDKQPVTPDVKINIIGSNDLASQIKDDSLVVNFGLIGKDADNVSLLCKAGKVPDVWTASFQICNGVNSHTISDLKSGEAYGIIVRAQDPVTGTYSSNEFSAFTYKKENSEDNDVDEEATQSRRPQTHLVGKKWNVHVPANMYTQAYTHSHGPAGAKLVSLYQEKNNPVFWSFACNRSVLDGSYEWENVRDSYGVERTYCHVVSDYSKFLNMTYNTIARNHLAITTPLSTLDNPNKFDARGNYVGFERLIVNAYDDPRMPTEALHIENLFTNICEGQESRFRRTNLPTTNRIYGEKAWIRVCKTRVNFGLTYGAKYLWVAQIVSGSLDTEIVYMAEWNMQPIDGAFAEAALRKVWHYFEPEAYRFCY